VSAARLVAVAGSLGAAAIAVGLVAVACGGLDGVTPDCSSPEAGCGIALTDAPLATDSNTPGDGNADTGTADTGSGADANAPDGKVDAADAADTGTPDAHDAGDAKAG
jgi:hypothetical protein